MSLFNDPLIDASHLFSVGQLDKAEELIRQTLSEDNTQSQHLAFLYKILFYADKYDQLISEAEINDFSLTKDFESHYFLYKSCMAVGHYQNAIKAIDNLLVLFPQEVSCLMDQAICYYQQSLLNKAEEVINQIINLQPENAIAYNNLGNVLKDKAELEAAQMAYKQAIQLQPDMADAYVGLAVIARQQDKYEACEQYLLSAINANFRHYLARYHLATLYQTQKQYNKAAQQWLILTELYPYAEDNYVILSTLYQQQGEIGKAISLLEHCLKHNPDSANIQHLYASLKQETTESAPREYIQALFNAYADSFDQHLAGELNYQTPQRLHDLWLSLDSTTHKLGDILDLGCGTGLSAQPFKPYANSLTGVDLSEGMIAKAREKALYDKLVVDDISHFTDQHKALFNTCLAIDVVNYTGNLSTLFRSIATSLKNQGFFLFSTEKSQQQDYSLQTNGRYQHSQAYVVSELSAAGFEVILSSTQSIRKEHEYWVEGELYICQKV